MNFSFQIEDPVVTLVVSLFLLFAGFVVFQFGIRVFGFLIGGAATFLSTQVIEAYSGSAISAWMYLGVSLVGGIIGFFLVPLFAKVAVMFLSFLFGLFLPELLAGVRGMIPFPDHGLLMLLVRVLIGAVFLVLAYRLFLQIVVVLSALVGSSLLAEFIGYPGVFIPLFGAGLLAQLFLMKRVPGKGVKKEERRRRPGSKPRPAPRPDTESRTWDH